MSVVPDIPTENKFNFALSNDPILILNTEFIKQHPVEQHSVRCQFWKYCISFSSKDYLLHLLSRVCPFFSKFFSI